MDKREENLPIALFNGPIVTTNGLYRISDISVEQGNELIRQYGFISAIGHEATAAILSRIFSCHIPMNRIQFYQEVGQKAIAFKLNKRPAEGRVLSEKEVAAIGFSLKLLERLE